MLTRVDPGGPPHEPEDRRVYAPADVAARLGVSGSGLRRLALIYERVYGDLPKDPKLGRVWPPEAIERLAAARADVQAGRAVSVEAALAAIRAGLEPPPPVQRHPAPPEPMEALLGELRLLRGAVEGMSRRLAALERENKELREAVLEVSAGGREVGEAPNRAPAPTPERAAAGDEPPREAPGPGQARPERGPWRRVWLWLRGRG